VQVYDIFAKCYEKNVIDEQVSYSGGRLEPGGEEEAHGTLGRQHNNAWQHCSEDSHHSER
jgi:hypothetical protein